MNPRLLLPARAHSGVSTSRSEVRRANATEHTGIQHPHAGANEAGLFPDEYRDRWRRRCPTGEGPPMNRGRGGWMAEQPVATWPLPRRLELLDRWFACGDPWVERNAHSMGAFCSIVGRLPRQAARPDARASAPRAGGRTAASGTRVHPQTRPVRRGPPRRATAPRTPPRRRTTCGSPARVPA